MSDDDLSLLERLNTVHSTVPSHEALFREAAQHLESLQGEVDFLESVIDAAKIQYVATIDGGIRIVDAETA